MKLYLQKSYNGTFIIAEKRGYKNELFTGMYYILLDNISGDMTYQALANLVVEKFGCTKLVLDF